MPRFTTLLFSTLLILVANAQKQLTPLRIGDYVPNTVIGRYINDPTKTVRLYDVKASLLLLDFWSVGCGTCISSIPKMVSLQNLFGQKVSILTITNDSPADITKTFSRLKLPFTTAGMIQADSQLLQLFPYNSVPHHVWIDSSYRIQYITIGSNATRQNFASFLNGTRLAFEKKYEFEKYDLSQPLWLEGCGRLADHLQTFSYLMRYVEGYNGGGIGRLSDKEKGFAGFRAYNMPLLSIIKAAWEEYPEQTFENDNRVSLEVMDTSAFRQPKDPNQYTDWCRSNAYSYELHLPMEMKARTFAVMQQDLLRFFNYDITVEKRTLPCLVLVRSSAKDKIHSNGLARRPPNYSKDSIVLNYVTVKEFVRGLNLENRQLKTPFVDETGYVGKADIYLGCWYTHTARLKEELKRLDLALLEENRTVDILVIREKNKGSK